MRTLCCVAALAGAMGPLTARAQDERRGPGVDFSGVYVGATEIRESEVYPLTAAGQRVQDAFDPLVQDPRQFDDCAPDTLPAVLWAGTVANMQVVQDDARLELRYEHGGASRSVHIDGVAPSASEPHTELGYSVGRWVDGVLTIETTHLTGGFIFNSRGYPLSPQTRITERYWRERGENDLQLELRVDDPVNYEQPFTLAREWSFSPDEQVRDWDCVSLGPRDAEPDIDELRRLLQEQ